MFVGGVNHQESKAVWHCGMHSFIGRTYLHLIRRRVTCGVWCILSSARKVSGKAV